VLLGQGGNPRTEMYYYHDSKLFAARKGDYKLYYYSNNPLGYPAKVEKLEKYQLFNLQHDPSEKYNVADQQPGVIKEIEDMVKKHMANLTPVQSVMDKRILSQKK